MTFRSTIMRKLDRHPEPWIDAGDIDQVLKRPQRASLPGQVSVVLSRCFTQVMQMANEFLRSGGAIGKMMASLAGMNSRMLGAPR